MPRNDVDLGLNNLTFLILGSPDSSKDIYCSLVYYQVCNAKNMDHLTLIQTTNKSSCPHIQRTDQLSHSCPQGGAQKYWVEFIIAYLLDPWTHSERSFQISLSPSPEDED